MALDVILNTDARSLMVFNLTVASVTLSSRSSSTSARCSAAPCFVISSLHVFRSSSFEPSDLRLFCISDLSGCMSSSSSSGTHDRTWRLSNGKLPRSVHGKKLRTPALESGLTDLRRWSRSPSPWPTRAPSPSAAVPPQRMPSGGMSCCRGWRWRSCTSPECGWRHWRGWRPRGRHSKHPIDSCQNSRLANDNLTVWDVHSRLSLAPLCTGFDSMVGVSTSSVHA